MHDVRETIRNSRPTVDELPPLDVDEIVRRGRRETMVARAASAAVALVLVAAVGVAFDAWRTPSSVDIGPVGDGPADGQPAADDTRWRQVDHAPVPAGRLRAAGTTDAGRLVLWGVRTDDPTTFEPSGAALDPADGSWQTIPPPPGLDVDTAQGYVAGSRLAVWDGGAAQGAVYDLDTGVWTSVPAPPSQATPVGFDGQHLILAADTALYLWTPEDGWDTSAAFPAGTIPGGHGAPAIDRDNHRVAILATPATPGFIYDLDADAWIQLPPSPLGDDLQGAQAFWWDGQLVAVNYQQADTHIITYDPSSQSWAGGADAAIEPPPTSPMSGPARVYPQSDGNHLALAASPGTRLGLWALTADGTWTTIDVPDRVGHRTLAAAIDGHLVLAQPDDDQWATWIGERPIR